MKSFISPESNRKKTAVKHHSCFSQSQSVFAVCGLARKQ